MAAKSSFADDNGANCFQTYVVVFTCNNRIKLQKYIVYGLQPAQQKYQQGSVYTLIHVDLSVTLKQILQPSYLFIIFRNV